MIGTDVTKLSNILLYKIQ